jgi:2-dehydro-3-deoxy-L-rhamnonate dehydrogenase (NAD+)
MFKGRFAGRASVITGGASGAGLAVARRIAAEGGQVMVWDFSEEQLARVRASDPDLFTCLLDVSDPQAVAAAAQKANRAMGRIDLLMNSAGITGPTTPVLEFPQDKWRQVLDIHLNGTFYCCQAVLPFMLANGYGRIVNMSSVAGKEGNPNLSAYSTAKAGLLGFTKSLGKELATTGVLVNAVTPAVFESALLEQMPQSQIDYMTAKIPMGRIGKIEDITSLVCWLLSEECSFSTAATFDVSGGPTTY